MTKLVYHPTLDTLREVPDDAVKEWEDAGWVTKKPAHVTSTAPAGPKTHPTVVDSTASNLPEVQVQDNTAVPTSETAKPIS